jgi:hypothetical protein
MNGISISPVFFAIVSHLKVAGFPRVKPKREIYWVNKENPEVKNSVTIEIRFNKFMTNQLPLCPLFLAEFRIPKNPIVSIVPERKHKSACSLIINL